LHTSFSRDWSSDVCSSDLSTWQLFEEFVRDFVEEEPSEKLAEAIGRLTARYRAIRQMSLSIAAALDAGEAPAVQASLVKDMGTKIGRASCTGGAVSGVGDG